MLVARRLLVAGIILALVGIAIYFSIRKSQVIRGVDPDVVDWRSELLSQLESKDRENAELAERLNRLVEQQNRTEEMLRKLEEAQMGRGGVPEQSVVLSSDVPEGAISLIELSNFDSVYVIEVGSYDGKRALGIIDALNRRGIVVNVQISKEFDSLDQAQRELGVIRSLGTKPVLRVKED